MGILLFDTSITNKDLQDTPRKNENMNLQAQFVQGDA